MSPAPSVFGPRRPIEIVAHRGYHLSVPENTLESFRLALLHGFDEIELDVYGTKDDSLVIFHDYSLDRMTDTTGGITTYTVREIKTFLVDGRYEIPTLGEYLKELVGSCTVTFIHLKQIRNLESVTRSIAEYDAFNRIVVYTDSIRHLAVLTAQDPRFVCGFWDTRNAFSGTVGTDSLSRVVQDLNLRYFFLPLSAVTMSTMMLLGRHGLKVMVYIPYAINDCYTLVENGVEGILTDRPDFFRAELR